MTEQSNGIGAVSMGLGELLIELVLLAVLALVVWAAFRILRGMFKK